MAPAPRRRVPRPRRAVALRPLGAGRRRAVGRAPTPGALQLGTEHRDLASLWEGLECFAAYGDDVEPAPLAAAATAALGRAPDASGLVDHDRIGAAWEQAVGKVSIMTMLFDELQPSLTIGTAQDERHGTRRTGPHDLRAHAPHG